MAKFSIKLLRGSEELAFSSEDVVELNIVEDIYNFCMSGNITFFDRVGWTEEFEALGSFDPIAIQWQSGENEIIEKIFNVYAADPTTDHSQHEPLRIRKWYFVETMLTTLQLKRKYSRSWGEDVLGSTIIKNICNDFLSIDDKRFIQFEETIETFDNFYSGYFTPADCILRIKKRCRGETSRQAGYLFYSNSKGINFVTLNTLLASTEREKKEVHVTGTQKDRMDKDHVRYVFSTTTGDSNQILGAFIYTPDAVDIDKLGGNRYLGFDFDGKKLITEDYQYTDHFESSEKGAPINLYGNSTTYPNINTVNAVLANECESDPQKLHNIHNYRFITKYMTSLMAYLIVVGESTRYAGMIIDVLWKSANSENITDKMLDGLWLVKSITHQFMPNSVPPYKQLLVCVKPGYNKIEVGVEYKPTRKSSTQVTGSTTTIAKTTK